jgi:pimeloyl-ACP methyl ester carboxylesterase
MYAALNYSTAPSISRQSELVNDHVLFWEKYGQSLKPPIVLLHHGLGSTSSWKAQISDFLEAGFQIFVYDRRGFGRSDYYCGYSAPDFQQDVDDLNRIVSDHLELPVILIGHSDGGTIASIFAARYPRSICCLVSVAAHIYIEQKMEQGIRSIKALYEQDTRFRDGLSRIHGDKYPQVFSNWYNGWLRPGNQNWDIKSELRKISCSTMIVQGMDDEYATPKHAQDMANEIPGAELCLMSDGNHMLPQEMAGQFNPRVLRFLESKCSTKC